MRSIKLYHPAKRPPLEFLRAGTLDDKRVGSGSCSDVRVQVPIILARPSRNCLRERCTQGEGGAHIGPTPSRSGRSYRFICSLTSLLNSLGRPAFPLPMISVDGSALARTVCCTEFPVAMVKAWVLIVRNRALHRGFTTYQESAAQLEERVRQTSSPTFLGLIRRALRTNYDEVAKEPLPERWVDLINHLNERESQQEKQCSSPSSSRKPS